MRSCCSRACDVLRLYERRLRMYVCARACAMHAHLIECFVCVFVVPFVFYFCFFIFALFFLTGTLLSRSCCSRARATLRMRGRRLSLCVCVCVCVCVCERERECVCVITSALVSRSYCP